MNLNTYINQLKDPHELMLAKALQRSIRNHFEEHYGIFYRDTHTIVRLSLDKECLLFYTEVKDALAKSFGTKYYLGAFMDLSVVFSDANVIDFDKSYTLDDVETFFKNHINHLQSLKF